MEVPGGENPPKAIAEVLFAAAPLTFLLAVFKSPTSVQLVPFQLSFIFRTTFDGFSPPNAKADVDVPEPPTCFLAVFILLTAVQFVPFQDSVAVVAGVIPPPIAKPAVDSPAPVKSALAVFKSFTSEKLLPLYNSVNATTAGVGFFPPNIKPDV